jgi:hypothetical protein
MGEDWKAKTERVYKHSLRRRAEGLTQQSMFISEEIGVTTYPCQLVDPARHVEIGTKLTVFQRSQGAKITVLFGTEVVATIEGEPAADLKETFSKHPDATRLFDVECVAVDKGAPVIEVCPAQKKRKKEKKQ